MSEPTERDRRIDEIADQVASFRGVCPEGCDCYYTQLSFLLSEVSRLKGEVERLECVNASNANTSLMDLAMLRGQVEAAESRAAKAEKDLAAEGRDLAALIGEWKAERLRAIAADEQVRTLREALAEQIEPMMNWDGQGNNQVWQCPACEAEAPARSGDREIPPPVPFPHESRCVMLLATPSPAPEHVCGLSGYNGMIDPPCPGPGHIGAYDEAAKVAELADNEVIFRMPGSLVENTKAYIAERIRALAAPPPVDGQHASPAPVPVETPKCPICKRPLVPDIDGLACIVPGHHRYFRVLMPAPAPEAAQETTEDCGHCGSRLFWTEARHVRKVCTSCGVWASPAKEER